MWCVFSNISVAKICLFGVLEIPHRYCRYHTGQTASNAPVPVPSRSRIYMTSFCVCLTISLAAFAISFGIIVDRQIGRNHREFATTRFSASSDQRPPNTPDIARASVGKLKVSTLGRAASSQFLRAASVTALRSATRAASESEMPMEKGQEYPKLQRAFLLRFYHAQRRCLHRLIKALSRRPNDAQRVLHLWSRQAFCCGEDHWQGQGIDSDRIAAWIRRTEVV